MNAEITLGFYLPEGSIFNVYIEESSFTLDTSFISLMCKPEKGTFPHSPSLSFHLSLSFPGVVAILDVAIYTDIQKAVCCASTPCSPESMLSWIV